jgi:rhamnulokinase
VPPFGPLIDPNDPAFLAPGDMAARVVAFCEATGQTPPRSRGVVVRCLLESLALKYRQTVELLRAVTGTPVNAIHIVGGGVRIEELCQLTADAVGCPVIAGPVEASAFGNLLVQAIALGELDSLVQARALVCDSVSPQIYEPIADSRWDDAVARLERISNTEKTAA